MGETIAFWGDLSVFIGRSEGVYHIIRYTDVKRPGSRDQLCSAICGKTDFAIDLINRQVPRSEVCPACLAKEHL